MKATAQMGGLTREQVERIRGNVLLQGPTNVGLLCDLALQAIKSEPVAWMCQMYADSSKVYFFTTNPDLRDDSPWDRVTPLFAAPPPPERP